MIPIRIICILFVACLIFINPVHAEPPDVLEGMKKIKQWTDYENKFNEMPSYIWGNHDGADRVGIYVEFHNGLTGSVTYNNLVKIDIWNRRHGTKMVYPTTSTGFFVHNHTRPLHILRNIPTSCKGEAFCLPMAWANITMPFSANFDLDYQDSNGSHFRAERKGWISVTITTYAVPISYVYLERQ